jgi:hypothetical protein
LFHISQLTLTLGSLLGQDVTPERLAMLIATFAGFFKPLGRTTTGFHFGHFHTPHSKLSLMVSLRNWDAGPLVGSLIPAKKKVETAKGIAPCPGSFAFAREVDRVKMSFSRIS